MYEEKILTKDQISCNVDNHRCLSQVKSSQIENNRFDYRADCIATGREELQDSQ